MDEWFKLQIICPDSYRDYFHSAIQTIPKDPESFRDNHSLISNYLVLACPGYNLEKKTSLFLACPDLSVAQYSIFKPACRQGIEAVCNGNIWFIHLLIEF